MSNTSDTNATSGPMSCTEYKEMLTSGLRPYQILVFLNPVDNIWTNRDAGWRSTFKVYIGLLGSVYLLIGIMCLFLLIKKDCIRLSTKTFFAVYTTIAILGFSRALLLALDPYDLVGFISDDFPAWIIVTRILGSFGFPSLVASYTLMVFTLLKVAKANPGKQWYHRWRYVIPIVVLPYIIAISAEVIGYLAEYPGLLSIIVCEVSFSLWGVTVCITYLFAGGRLMHQLRRRERNTVKLSGAGISKTAVTEGPSSSSSRQTQTDFATQEYERHHKHNRRTARKIAIITYGTVVLAAVYSFFTCGNIIMVSLFLFKECLGFTGVEGDSDAWLALHILIRTTEITLAVIMLYSITDINGMVKFVSRMFMGMCFCCCKRRRVTESSRKNPPHPLEMAGMLNDTTLQTNILENSRSEVLINRDDFTKIITTSVTSAGDMNEMRGGMILEDNDAYNSGDSRIQLEAMTSNKKNYPSTNSTLLNNPRTFLLNASKGESSSSIESNAQPMTTIIQEKSQPQQAASSKQSATLVSVSVEINRQDAETTDKCDVKVETDDVTELQVENKERQPESAIPIDTRSPVHLLEYVQTVNLDTDDTTQTVELSKASQTETTKPVPISKRFTHRTQQERQEKLREQNRLLQNSPTSAKLNRKQTV